MKTVGIRDILTKKELNERLEETYKNLSLCISMASGYVWKEKVNSFSKLIAKELLDFFEEESLQIEYLSFKNQFYRIKINDNNLCFQKNNLFQEDKKLDKKNFLNQELLYLEKCELPSYLTALEKEDMMRIISKEDSIILNQGYNRQELNGNRYFLVAKEPEKEKLLAVLKKAHFFSITVEEYLISMANGLGFIKIENEQGIKTLETTYQNYILELGAYIAKEIKKSIKK